jgi:hypothetical protein
MYHATKIKYTYTSFSDIWISEGSFIGEIERFFLFVISTLWRDLLLKSSPSFLGTSFDKGGVHTAEMLK